MAEAHVGPLPEGMKRCKVCAEPINEKAVKCIHCQAEQSWARQRLGFSSTILSLLVALITVLTAAVPVVRDSITSKNSNLIFSFQAANDRVISVLASNTGVRPGSIGSSYLHMNQKRNYGLRVSGVDSARVVEPGKSELIALTRDSRPIFADEDTDDPRNPKCFLFLHSTDFIGVAEYHKVVVPCTSFIAFEANAFDGVTKR
ncbi:hypothetical protein [Bradyrhizobium sp. LMTR 3]|uniref:hypothetical protein n=1 Tax=Bradyrhizobium sp. LMTR 3 TaxID=189873 RepID=UPI000810C51F|nr:hypothetical protein [Bradyrhizobium sp. LMTR 3]OCK59855.1 hypothetical protein LMTR3_19740 [Bradyrhizobium sp. LMTR 3]